MSHGKATSRPRTSADIVAISPIPTLTASFDSALKMMLWQYETKQNTKERPSKNANKDERADC